MWEEIVRWAKVLGPFVFLYWVLRSGVRHRKGSWQRRDWVRFGLVSCVPIILIAVAFAMAVAVDRGIYDRIPPQYHHIYLWTLVGIALAGAGTAGSLIGWFAYGDP